MRNRLQRVLGAAFLCTAITGCGGGVPDDAPEVAPVSGKVTRKGQPFAGVTVSYRPIEASGELMNSSNGYTDENGEYTLVYNRNLNGAVIGKHEVRLSKGDGIDDQNEDVAAPDEVVIPLEQAIHEVSVPAEGLEGGAANFDLDF